MIGLCGDKIITATAVQITPTSCTKSSGTSTGPKPTSSTSSNNSSNPKDWPYPTSPPGRNTCSQNSSSSSNRKRSDGKIRVSPTKNTRQSSQNRKNPFRFSSSPQRNSKIAKLFRNFSNPNNTQDDYLPPVDSPKNMLKGPSSTIIRIDNPERRQTMRWTGGNRRKDSFWPVLGGSLAKCVSEAKHCWKTLCASYSYSILSSTAPTLSSVYAY